MRPHTSASNHRKVNRAKNLTTVFSYGDPAQPLYKNKEVDLMGVDGIIYHGRLDSTLPSYPSDKEPSGLKSPQPPFRLERARSATAHRQSGFSFSRSNSKSAWSSQNALHIPSSSDSLQQSSDS
ncbi:hypothetical protein GDO86_020171 [Hymenochirus boettgeri]|nr:hypothetical protein GDO86_020171 [Hymenochirus boettgeri]